MVISKIETDKYHPPNHILECTSETDIVNAVHVLDGKDITIVNFFTFGDDYMTIAGGNVGRYICYITIGNNEKFINLLNADTNWDEQVEIMTGKTLGLYECKFCLSLKMVLNAAIHYANYGTPHPDYLWDDN